ncbi:ATP-binding cassette sub- A member 1 [Irineochytrium annulatum]|nr:ATP-binding cassette sub- A member 1 [Irineochytrium annulatum]
MLDKSTSNFDNGFMSNNPKAQPALGAPPAYDVGPAVVHRDSHGDAQSTTVAAELARPSEETAGLDPTTISDVAIQTHSLNSPPSPVMLADTKDEPAFQSTHRLPSVTKTSKSVERGFLMTFFQQLSIMLRKNTILQLRYKAATLSQTVVAPFIFHLILYVLQQSDFAAQRVSNPYPPTSPLEGVPPCQGATTKSYCLLFLYYPATSQTTSFMTTFAAVNSRRTGTDLTVLPTTTLMPGYAPVAGDETTIRPAESVQGIYDYALAKPNTTRWAVVWDVETLSGPNLNVRYQVWFNGSQTANGTDYFGRELLSVVRGIDEAIITTLAGGKVNATLDYQMKDWPVLPAMTLSDDVIQKLGPMVIFINIMNQIVSEKESKLRLAMEMMGLKPVVYWLSHVMSSMLMVAINSFLSVILGLAFQFDAFLHCDFGVLFITFFLFGLSMVMFGMFLTAFVGQSKTAVLLGIFIFVIGLLFESFVFSSGNLGYIWWAPTIVTPLAWQSFSWTQLYNVLPSKYQPMYDVDLPNPVQAWQFMLLNILGYSILLWYFDNVIPDPYGTSKPPWFFILPSYWGYVSTAAVQEERWMSNVLQATRHLTPPPEDEDVDVNRERRETLNGEGNAAIRLVNLRKVYSNHKSFLRAVLSKEEGKVAVADMCLRLEEGKLLALLGQNGAGKSTTMSILSGLTPPSAGDALIYGLSVKSQMGCIRKMLGVCPQHDILFEDLTAKEHIELYAGLKGVPKANWRELFQERLRAVKLWTVRDVRSGTYSGGY